METTSTTPAADAAPRLPWRVREAQPCDVPQLVAMQLRLAEETEGIQLDAALLERGIRRPFEQPALSRYFVATLPPGASGEGEGEGGGGGEGLAVAMLGITFEWSDWRCGMFYWIESVYTLPAHRHRGAFTALYEHVRELCARDPDACGLRLYVEDDNAAAQEVYHRMGMEREHYRMMKWTKATAY